MTQRKIKVTAESRRNQHKMYSHSVAGIRLSGRWFERAGFMVGELAQVLVSDGIVQIIKDTTPKEVVKP